MMAHPLTQNSKLYGPMKGFSSFKYLLIALVVIAFTCVDALGSRKGAFDVLRVLYCTS